MRKPHPKGADPRQAELIYIRCVRPFMPTPDNRAVRRDRQAAEVEASQARLRASIAETARLVDESETMLRRHRRESDDADL